MIEKHDFECELAVVGLGFVGLPAALMAANVGLRVVGCDINRRLLETLESGACPIDEPKVVELFKAVREKGTFKVQLEVPIAGTYVVAVPTPLHKRKKVADLTALLQACEALVPKLRKGALVIVESTIPPMTCREEIAPILERSGLRVGADIFLSHCPERLYPGDVVQELLNNDRIIGGCCPVARERSKEFYAKFVKGHLYVTDDLTAEFCKLMENTYRDVNVALANELYLVASKLGISITHAIELANKHPRVNLLKPGIGVGGHCIPIDPWFISEVAPSETMLIPTARRINDTMPSLICARIRERLGKIAGQQLVLGVCGVAYKPNVNDQRESPAWTIIHELKRDGYQVEVFDPVVGVGSCRNLEEFAVGKDALVVLVEHGLFLEELKTRTEQIKKTLRNPVILDYRELQLS